MRRLSAEQGLWLVKLHSAAQLTGTIVSSRALTIVLPRARLFWRDSHLQMEVGVGHNCLWSAITILGLTVSSPRATASPVHGCGGGSD